MSASWWILSNFSVFNSSRAILVENSSDVVLTNLDVSHTLHSAVRIRNNSTRILFENNHISYTGRGEANNGEALYMGTSISHWKNNSPDRTNKITVQNNYFGPNVTSESIDIKEGTDSILIQNNRINGSGMQDENYSLTWISVKGTGCTIQNNTGIYSVQDGFTVIVLKLF